MRKITYPILFVFAVLFSSACSKNVDNTILEEQNLEMTTLRSQMSYTEHNAFLDAICDEIEKNNLSVEFTQPNIEKFKDITQDFFYNVYGEDYSDFINQIIDVKLGDGTLFEFGNDPVSTLISQSLPLMDEENPLSPTEFNTLSYGYYQQISATAAASSIDYGLEEVLGVMQGSYYYWYNVSDNSCYYNIFNSTISHNNEVESRACDKCKKWAKFFKADVLGAGSGAGWGSILPGVGTGAGAVIGGSIVSGLEALSWD